MTERSDTVVARSFAQDRSQVYVELTKPRITLMVMLTVAIGYALAPAAVHAPFALLHVLVGAFLSCSGAGALNQLIERDVDGAMNRTRFRPLPAHRVSPSSVLMLGTAMGAGGVVYLALTTNATTALLDAITLVTYLFIYTPLKRVSSLSTLVGAVPGALPPVMGWAAATSTVAPNALILFSILFLWQIPHFLAIGRMYQEDYASGGLPMLAVVDEDGSITGRQMSLYALALIPVSLMPPLVGLTGNLYFWAAFAAGLAYLGASINAAVRGGRGAARQLLLISVLYLPVLFAAMLVDRIGG